MVDPSRSVSLPAALKMFWNLADIEAASSPDSFVATWRSAMTRVNERMSSRATPNCPAFSAILESSTADTGIVRAIWRMPCSSSLSWVVVPPTVRATPANALSKSIEALTAYPPSAARGAEIPSVMAVPAEVRLRPKVFAELPIDIRGPVKWSLSSIVPNSVPMLIPIRRLLRYLLRLRTRTTRWVSGAS